jgi:dTDP-4-dehydrorhamnose reductase
MHKVLILGLGYVGNKLKAYLERHNVTVTALNQKNFNYACEDTLRKYLSNQSFDYVINCCGYTGVPNVDACELNKEACWHLNVVTGLMINRVCTELNIKHIFVSSGCIYTGYTKDFTEEDVPNFGLYNKESSFYSKSKHALETVFNFSNSAILRIRMPFDGELENKNYLYKIYKYSSLISYDNSLTFLPDLCRFILNFMDNSKFKPGIFNIVNTERFNAIQIVEMFKKYNCINPNWQFVNMSDLDIVAGRSNCVLSTRKIQEMNLELLNTSRAVETAIQLLALKINDTI